MVIYQMHKNNQIKSEYVSNVKNVINTFGFSGIWDSQSIPNSNWFKLAVSRKLNDQYLQEWSSLVDSSLSGNNYKLFKEIFG